MLRKARPMAMLRNLTTTLLALTVIGVAAVPAHAESVRERQWHLDAMHAEDMWKTSRGEGITVAVIDSGVDPSLPDLQGQVLKGKDFSGRAGDAHDDYDGHGTRMAALITATGAAGPDRGSFGLAPQSKILPLRVEEASSYKNEAEALRNFGKDVSPAIRYAAESQAKIINISLGSDAHSHKLENAIDYALSKGKIIFASAGNTGDIGNKTRYPSGAPGVVGVAAVDEKSRATDESQHGKQVDLSAPGKEMYSACLEDTRLCVSDGTSNSAALASASAALVWAEHPDWTANQVTRVLVNTAEGPKSGAERNDSIGHGMVRPHIALKNPGDPGDPNTNPLPGPYNEEKASKKSDNSGEDEQQAAASDDGSGPNWLGYGLAAAGVLAAGGATGLFVRHRRRAAASVYPTAPYGPPPAGPPPPPWP